MDTEVYCGEGPAEIEICDPHQNADEYLAKNPFRIFYQTNNFFLPQIRDMIKTRSTINLRPEYQRRLCWTKSQRSRLIESFLLNIPVPPIFLLESSEARYEVIDGQQRLNAIDDFFSGNYALSGLKVMSALNGLGYSKCTPRVRRALDRATISVIVLLKETEAERLREGRFNISDVRRLVFGRLNTGGRQLNAQEIRSALNPGPLNDCIIKCSRFRLFTDVFGIPPYNEKNQNHCYDDPDRRANRLYASMGDCELVLRFVALRDIENIGGSMESMLDRAMEKQIDNAEADVLFEEFCSRFSFLHGIFGRDLFRLPSKGDQRDTLSAALYDASMVAMDRVWTKREQVGIDQDGVKARLQFAINDNDRYELLVGRKNNAESICKRIELLESILLPS